MKFVNRKQELSRLNRAARRKEACLAVLWGRRRVGKSRLLQEWSRKHQGVYYTADESAASIQRKYFAMAIEQALPGFAEVEYPDWRALFIRLAQDASRLKWKGPLIIDEIPYLIQNSPELTSIIQKFIDHEAKKAKLLIVLCGSSQRMMQGAILSSSAPLYGRAQEILKLSPLTIGYMQEALNIKNSREILESYAIWGGIPRYWELVEKTKGNFWEKIDRIVLDPLGPLNEEPARLLLEESAMHLRPLLDAIGLGAHRLSEIAGRIGQPSTSLMRSLQSLMELDFIQRENPYGADVNNSKKTLYKIKDPFLRFWFYAVGPKRSLFSQVTPAKRISWLKQRLPYLYSMIWEELCRLAIPALSLKWKEGMYGPAGRFWHGEESEWDILAQSEDNTSFLIGEAKWTKKRPTLSWVYRTIDELKNKEIPPVKRPPDVKLRYVLFIPEKPTKMNLSEDVRVVDAREIIRSLK